MFQLLYNYTVGGDYTYFNEFGESVFPSVGIITIVFSLIVCLLYYPVINRLTDKFDQFVHWIIFLVLCGVFGGVFAYVTANNFIVGEMGDTEPRIPVLFWVMNAIYAILYFFIFSVLLKKTSKYATLIPF
ncbi:MAG: hypothetical protein K1X92_14815 [Bacteroidia bacterium]|nr:hypothetical protein [Bacteroidia bacterium]